MTTTNSLDYSQQELTKLLDSTVKLISGHYEKVYDLKGYNNFSQAEVSSWFDEPLPIEGKDSSQLLQEVKQKVIDTATGNLGTNMYSYVVSGGNQVSTVAEFIASTINQNCAKWHLAPSMAEIEKRVIKWTAEMINYLPGAGGAMVSGGSEATLAGLTVARNIYFRKLNLNQNGLFGQKIFTIYCSKETHNCINKSVALLGIGTKHLRRIDTNGDFTVNSKLLEEKIIEDLQNGFHPFCIIGNAGTVNTGAIDDLSTLATLAKKYDMWFHVDGAYGGLASSLPNLKKKYSGIELADSIALDFHKWLYQPFEAGCFLVKNWSILRETYYQEADYLSTASETTSSKIEFNEHYFQLSRNAKAFKVWMSLKAFGFKKIQAMIQKDIELAQYLSKQIDASDDFELKATSNLAIVCFRFKGRMSEENKIVNINHKLIGALEADGRVFINGTKLNNVFVLRACLINHRKSKESILYLLNTIRDVASKL